MPPPVQPASEEHPENSITILTTNQVHADGIIASGFKDEKGAPIRTDLLPRGIRRAILGRLDGYILSPCVCSKCRMHPRQLTPAGEPLPDYYGSRDAIHALVAKLVTTELQHMAMISALYGKMVGEQPRTTENTDWSILLSSRIDKTLWYYFHEAVPAVIADSLLSLLHRRDEAALIKLLK